jgi:prepilin-type processing-associated H-X9-DG protein
MNARAQCLAKWELVILIVCGIFVLLTVGAVGEQGRRRAREIVCQANLHRWHDIFQGYIDPNGRFISGDKGTPGYWWVKYLSEEHKDWKRTRIWFCPTASGPVMDENGHSTQSLTIFSAWGVYQGVGLGPNGISGSYALNGYLIPLPLPTRQGSVPPRVPPPTITYENGVPAEDGWQNLHEVPHANTVPMFVDALRFDLWPLPTNAPASDEFAAWSANHMARCCINRHDGAVNCLFVDGSVRKVGLKELWTLKWHQSFNTAGPWTMAGGVMSSDWPEWIRPFKDY